LVIKKPTTQPDFDILNELKNICVKIPLLQAIKEIPIYSKVVKELCIKNPGRKQKDPPKVYLVGGISEYILEQPKLAKYGNPGNPVVNITINELSIGNTLIDLGADINVMTATTLEQLQLQPLLWPTPTILELADKTRVIPEGILDDFMVTLASWEYPIDFLVIHSKDPARGHLVIFGRPWLAKTNAFIGCREGEMTISNGLSIQKLTIYPLSQPIIENIWWLECRYENKYWEEPVFPSDHARALQEHTTKNVLNQFISAITCVNFPESFPQFEYMFGEEFQEQLDPSILSLTSFIFKIDESAMSYTMSYKISIGKYLHINSKLDTDQHKELVDILKEQSRAFVWEYIDMKGIHPDTCIHHIYTQGEVTPIRQPQTRMNPTLKDIVKEEIQKLLNVEFIYPIFDSKWVSLLVVVPKKVTRKWIICIDFRELNKATLKDYFPLPFIDQVLDTLSGKKYFFFLDGYNEYN
jgi:hypothetical protein